jgi:hypothetical protein
MEIVSGLSLNDCLSIFFHHPTSLIDALISDGDGMYMLTKEEHETLQKMVDTAKLRADFRGTIPMSTTFSWRSTIVFWRRKISCSSTSSNRFWVFQMRLWKEFSMKFVSTKSTRCLLYFLETYKQSLIFNNMKK